MTTKAVVGVAGALGDIVEHTPLVNAATDMYDEVYVWSPNCVGQSLTILDDMPGLCATTSVFLPEMAEPDVALLAWFFSASKQVRRQLRAKRLIQSRGKQLMAQRRLLRELALQRGEPDRRRFEYEVAMDLAVDQGWSGLARHYVGSDPWPHDLSWANRKWLVLLTTGHTNKRLWQIKRYPARSYAKLASLLHTCLAGDVCIAQVGADHDQRIESPYVTDLRGQATLRQTIGLIKRADLVIGNDTGLCHASGGAGVPTVQVFGPTDPQKSRAPFNTVAVAAGLYCQPCSNRRGMGFYPDTGRQCRHECLDELDHWHVAKAAMQQLGVST